MSGEARFFRFGRATDQALVGDWDGDGVDTVALRRGSAIFFAGDNVDGGGTVTSSVWGRASDVAVAGSYAGQEYDTVALRRGNVFITTVRPRFLSRQLRSSADPPAARGLKSEYRPKPRVW